MIYVTYNGNQERKAYRTLQSARIGMYRWCVQNKGKSADAFDTETTTKPFGSAMCFQNDSEPTWFRYTDVDIRYPDEGCSEDVGKITQDGTLIPL